MIRILIVDDHVSSRESLAFLLDREPEFSVVAQAASVSEATSCLEDVDVAIVDLRLPDGSGIDIVRHLRSHNRDAAVLCLTASEDDGDFASAVESGASGVFHKSVSTRDIVDAVRRLHIGEPVHTTDEIIRLFRVASERRKKDDFAKNAVKQLTHREREVLQALAWGFSDKEIAVHLKIGERTARSHMANILSKLQVESRLQAVILAMRVGAVTAETSPPPLSANLLSHLSHETNGGSAEHY